MPNLSGTSAALGSGEGVEVSTEPGHRSVTHEPAAATKATCTFAALANGRHVCKEISASIAAGATAQTPISVRLLDGSTVIWSMKLSAPINTSAIIYLTDLSIPGSVNTAMTLEFAAAGVAASEQTVNLSVIDITGQ